MAIHSAQHLHRKPSRTYAIYAVSASIGLLLSTAVLAGPNVAVSIAPIHSLVSGVMDGVATPALLIPAEQSPHSNALKPSSVKHIYAADLIIWVGPNYEIALSDVIAQASKNRLTKSLGNLQELQTYPVRSGGLWHSDEDHGDKDQSHKQGQYQQHHLQHIDPHFWLSTANARILVDRFRVWLTAVDPENSATYQSNAERLISRIDTLQNALQQQLTAVQAIPYMVLHDAYQYFEKQFNLNSVGSITSSPETPPGVKRVQAIRKMLVADGVKCLFNEPQFKSGLIPALIEDTDVRLGQLDPLAMGHQVGTELWFELMTETGQSLTRCLKQP